MSIVNLKNLSDSELISQFVLAIRNQGCQLAYDDLRTINDWLKRAKSAERLLEVLNCELPAFYEKKKTAGRFPPLRFISKKIERLLSSPTA